jgi:hypothetical protein
VACRQIHRLFEPNGSPGLRIEYRHFSFAQRSLDDHFGGMLGVEQY